MKPGTRLKTYLRGPGKALPCADAALLAVPPADAAQSHWSSAAHRCHWPSVPSGMLVSVSAQVKGPRC